VISCLIYYNGFFKLFTDEHITKKQFSLFFLLKTLAIPAFYLVYQRVYGGIEKFDTGKFYNDAKVIADFAKTDLNFYLRFLLGLQDDSEGSYDYMQCLVNTLNWDNGKVKDFLYNDNRVLIRVHTLVHFFAFNSYFVHALFNCFLSFIGINYLYRSFKEFFKGKEMQMMIILCFFPSLWFYTGALLKEGIALFVVGCGIWQLKNIISGNRNMRRIIRMAFLLFLAVLLKPYFILFAFICFAAFFVIYQNEKIRRKIPVFLSAIFILLAILNGISLFLRHKSLPEAALAHQRLFAGASKGGIFLYDNFKFVRLKYDTLQVNQIAGKPGHFTIKKNVPYQYWEDTHQQDTLYNSENTDTITQFKLMYQIAESGSNIDPAIYSNGPVQLITYSFYYTLFYPFFFNARNLMQMLASFENLLIVISLIIIFYGVFTKPKDKFLPLTFIFFALGLCLLIGITTPNSGAIFRYRSPAALFLLLSALYYFGMFKREDKTA
jgi:hypothetical protein